MESIDEIVEDCPRVLSRLTGVRLNLKRLFTVGAGLYLCIAPYGCGSSEENKIVIGGIEYKSERVRTIWDSNQSTGFGEDSREVYRLHSSGGDGYEFRSFREEEEIRKQESCFIEIVR